MAEKVVSVRLQARVEGFTAGMSKAKKSVDDLTKAAAPSKADAFGKLADKAAIAGLGVATAVGVAVKRFADFDQAMSAVQANSGATGASLEALRNTAVKMGADSQFSATEAAQGINEMAKAGVATKDILGGGLKGALDLAAAGQISVADSAESMASALSQFNLDGTKATHVADLLSNTASAAQGGVGDLSAALANVGVAANGAGLNIDETTTILGLFAKNGLVGAEAGTALKTMVQRLSAPTAEAAAEMERLGIAAYDNTGQFIGAEKVMGQLAAATKGMGDQQRAAAFDTIFGTYAITAAGIAADEGADGYRAMNAEVTKVGGASKQAAALTNNLKGDIERLGGALDSVFIQTGSSANGTLRSLTQGLTGLIDYVGRIPGPVLLAGGALTAFALLAPKGVLKYREYTAQLDSLGVSLDKISAKAPRTGKALEIAGNAAKGLGAGLAAAAAADMAFGADGKGIGVQGLTAELLKSDDAVAAFSARVKDYADSQSNWFNTDFVQSYGDVLHAAFDPSVGQNIDKVAGSLAGVSTDVSNANDRLNELDQILAGLAQGGQTDKANALFLQFAAAAKSSGVSVDQLKSKLPSYTEALAGMANAAVTTATQQGTLTDSTGDLEKSADDAKKALDNLRDAIEGLGSPLAAQRAAERDFQAAIDDASGRLEKQKELQKELHDAEAEPAKTKAERQSKADDIARITKELEAYSRGFDVNTEAGRTNQAMLDNIQQTTLKNVAATFDLTGSTEKATAVMQRGRDAFINAATAAGMSASEAKKLADNLGLVPKNVSILVKQTGAQNASDQIDLAARDRVATILVQRRIADERDRRQDAANSYPVKKATGGAIMGPGSGTSDSIAALLSNGEHVWTAAEVQKLGGQAAMYALRAAVRSGNLPKFATGGAVASQFAPVRLAPSLTVSRGSSDGMGRQFVSGSLDLGNGLNGYVRAIVADELTNTTRRKGLVPRG